MVDLDIFNELELRFILHEYDYYIQEAVTEELFDQGWYPVCVSEFITNDLIEIIDEIENITDSKIKILSAKSVLNTMINYGVI